MLLPKKKQKNSNMYPGSEMNRKHKQFKLLYGQTIKTYWEEDLLVMGHRSLQTNH